MLGKKRTRRLTGLSVPFGLCFTEKPWNLDLGESVRDGY